MKAKDCPMTKALCQLVSQALADAEKEVIGPVQPTEEGALEEIPIEASGLPASSLRCMDKLKEAQRWCEETEIFGT